MERSEEATIGGGGGEWELIKVLYEENLTYILKSIRHPFLLTRPKPHIYRKAIGTRNQVRSHENTMEDNNR
jgi:hypothetical protein